MIHDHKSYLVFPSFRSIGGNENSVDLAKNPTAAAPVASAASLPFVGHPQLDTNQTFILSGREKRLVITGWAIWSDSWLDFDFSCCTFCQVRLGLMGNWQNWLSKWGRWWNI